MEATQYTSMPTQPISPKTLFSSPINDFGSTTKSNLELVSDPAVSEANHFRKKAGKDLSPHLI